MDQIYEDKLEGNIDEEFWKRKQAEYREQERQSGSFAFKPKCAGHDENRADGAKDF